MIINKPNFNIRGNRAVKWVVIAEGEVIDKFRSLNNAIQKARELESKLYDGVEIDWERDGFFTYSKKKRSKSR